MNLIDTLESLAQAVLDEQQTKLDALDGLDPKEKGPRLRVLRGDITLLDSYPAFEAAVLGLSPSQHRILVALTEAGIYSEDTIEQRLDTPCETRPEWAPQPLLNGIARARAENYDLSLFEV